MPSDHDDGYPLVELAAVFTIIAFLVAVMVPSSKGPGDSAQVLLYARSRSGACFGTRLAVAGTAPGRFTYSGDTEAQMTLAGCTGRDW